MSTYGASLIIWFTELSSSQDPTAFFFFFLKNTPPPKISPLPPPPPFPISKKKDGQRARVVRTMPPPPPATIFPIRHPWDATLASQMRIGIPPDENLSDVHEFKSHIPVHSMNQTLLTRAPGSALPEFRTRFHCKT